MKNIYLLGFCLLLGACNLLNPLRQAPKPLYPDLEITMERGMCLGTCPVYRLTIYGDGKVIYEGKEEVAVKGQQTITISPEQIQDLVTAIMNADFFSFGDAYRIMAYDLPSVTLSITLNGHSKRIYHYGYLTCDGDLRHDVAPKELCDLEEKIDAIVDTNQWINPK